MSLMETKSLLYNQKSTQQERNHSRNSSEWSENDNGGDSGESSSYSSSIYSKSTESFVNEWESFVTEDKRLFYIKFNPIIASKNEKLENSLMAAKNQFSRVSTRRSNKISKLSRFVAKSGKTIINDAISNITEAKVKFSETSEGETKELYLFLDPSNRYRFGRRSTICESLLGLSVSPFADGQRLMVANFMPNFNCSNNVIKIGDWLKNINNFEINSLNINEILLSFTTSCDILLKLQKMSDEEEIQLNELECSRITSLGMICDTLEEFFENENDNKNYLEGFQDIFSLMYLTMEGLEEQGPEGQDVLYCYPQKHENFLYSSRGSFLTLNSILKSGFNSTPEVTTISFAENTYNISYTPFNDDLLLVAVRNDILTKSELKFKTFEIINYFELMNRSLSENFYPSNLVNINCYCKLLKIDIIKKKMPKFEKGLLLPHYVPLPKEAQLRIDDALSEMEAMDYREWNSEPLKSQREFFIVGSLLYYKSYLLASHLPPSDLLHVESFLRMNGLFEILNTNITIKELIIWNEIYPKNYFSNVKKNNTVPPQERWFLAVIGMSQMLIVAILEYRCREIDVYSNNKMIEPSPFYVEEIQDTLDHLKLGGIEKLASTWMLNNRRPQINLDSVTICHRAFDNMQYLKPKAELISILKRKNSTENIAGGVGSSSIHSQTISEDSDRKFSQNDDEECDSDWDGFPSESQKSSSGFDISEMTETLLKEVSDILPTKITAGVDNVLFHYVQIELGETYILAPTNVVENDIIQIFRQSCHLIHTVLQNTLKFRKILSEDGQKSILSNQHRSLVAIKEHGILFNVKDEKNGNHEFWVIGRLFNSPVRELYICHRADVPQNLVEIAFRLNLHTVG